MSKYLEQEVRNSLDIYNDILLWPLNSDHWPLNFWPLTIKILNTGPFKPHLPLTFTQLTSDLKTSHLRSLNFWPMTNKLLTFQLLKNTFNLVMTDLSTSDQWPFNFWPLTFQLLTTYLSTSDHWLLNFWPLNFQLLTTYLTTFDFWPINYWPFNFWPLTHKLLTTADHWPFNFWPLIHKLLTTDLLTADHWTINFWPLTYQLYTIDLSPSDPDLRIKSALTWYSWGKETELKQVFDSQVSFQGLKGLLCAQGDKAGHRPFNYISLLSIRTQFL